MEYEGLTRIPGGDSFLGDQGPTEGSLLVAVLPYVVTIILLPIASFFFTKTYVFVDIFAYSDTTASVYSAICAVVVLHLLLALFIMQAFRQPSKSTKQD